jgi:hypothetical protein
MPKPEKLIPHLQALCYDPAAERSYEMMSGGFMWSDELPPSDVYFDPHDGDYALRFLLGYRASLIRGRPDEGLRPVWDAVLAACPNWPGFRSERCSVSLAAELEKEGKASMRHLERISRVLDKAGGGDETD